MLGEEPEKREPQRSGDEPTGTTAARQAALRTEADASGQSKIHGVKYSHTGKTVGTTFYKCGEGMFRTTLFFLLNGCATVESWFFGEPEKSTNFQIVVSLSQPFT